MKPFIRNLLCSSVLATVLVGALRENASAATFTVQVRNSASGGGPFASGSDPVDSGEVTFASNLGQPDAFAGRAMAGNGILRARGLSTIQGIPGLSNGVSGESRASFIMDDLFITGPIGITTVAASLNLNVNGLVATAVPAGSAADASFSLSVSGPFGGSGTITDSSGTLSANGMFAGLISHTVSGTSTSGSGNLSTTAANRFEIGIVAGGGAGWSSGRSGEVVVSESSFFNTINFPTSGMVFNLPEGYTANSISGRIVNNQWTGAVPEPSTTVFVTLCLMGYVCRFRVRHRREIASLR